LFKLKYIYNDYYNFDMGGYYTEIHQSQVLVWMWHRFVSEIITRNNILEVHLCKKDNILKSRGKLTIEQELEWYEKNKLT